MLFFRDCNIFYIVCTLCYNILCSFILVLQQFNSIYKHHITSMITYTAKHAILAAGLLVGVSAEALPADRCLKIEHLSPANKLVRISSGHKYLLLPIQESSNTSFVRLLANGRAEEKLNIRLAQSKVDYYVPLDLSAYADAEIALLIDLPSEQTGSSLLTPTTLHSTDETTVMWDSLKISDTFDITNREKFRPRFHHTPPYGWMNDPNGMFYKDGVWHLYYQYNPYDSKWNNLSWGHATSTDLIHWTPQPKTLRPDELGLIFSGSGAVDKTGSAGFGKDAVVFLYTSAGATQQQSLGWSTDSGQTINVYPGNPVITLPSEARDPNMFWDEESGKWVLTLAHALDHEMLFFTSPDMKEWTLEGNFGKGIGCQDGVWECPDLFQLPVEGSKEKKWVLLCNINPGGPFGGSATQYFIGDFDGKKFVADTDASGNIPTRWMDFGKDHYATVSFSDAPSGRRTVIGWMSNWQYASEVPTLQFRSANTLPRDLSLFKGNDGLLYLASAPSPELLAMRGKTPYEQHNAKIGNGPISFSLPQENDGICEIVANINPRKATAITLTLSNADGEKTVMTYDPKNATFSVDRTESGLTSFSKDFPAVTVSPTFSKKRNCSLRIFIDRSSIEVFGDNGHFVQTNLVFPESPYTTLTVTSDDRNASLENLTIYPLDI